MWPVYCVILFFTLALVVPPVWSSSKVYRHAKHIHSAECPARQSEARLRVDGLYAIRSNLVGDPVWRVTRCSFWPEQAGCGQECMAVAAGKRF
jgi:hypothetical protein